VHDVHDVVPACGALVRPLPPPAAMTPKSLLLVEEGCRRRRRGGRHRAATLCEMTAEELDPQCAHVLGIAVRRDENGVRPNFPEGTKMCPSRFWRSLPPPAAMTPKTPLLVEEGCRRRRRGGGCQWAVNACMMGASAVPIRACCADVVRLVSTALKRDCRRPETMYCQR